MGKIESDLELPDGYTFKADTLTMYRSPFSSRNRLWQLNEPLR